MPQANFKFAGRAIRHVLVDAHAHVAQVKLHLSWSYKRGKEHNPFSDGDGRDMYIKVLTQESVKLPQILPWAASIFSIFNNRERKQMSGNKRLETNEKRGSSLKLSNEARPHIGKCAKVVNNTIQTP